MIKSEIIKELSNIGYCNKKNYKISQNEIKLIVDKLFEFMASSIVNGKRLEVRGFGCFSLRKRIAGTVRNPRYGVNIPSVERHNVYFRAGKSLAERVNSVYETK